VVEAFVEEEVDSVGSTIRRYLLSLVVFDDEEEEEDEDEEVD